MKIYWPKNILSFVFKVILFVLLIGVIYWQLKYRSSDINVFDSFKNAFSWRQFPFLFAALLLMPVNVFLESTKWRLFINEFQKKFDITDALKSMLCGSFFGFITPNRIGEFLGRLNRIKKENRSRALTAGYWGGIAQFLVTFSFGIYLGGKTILQHINFYSLEAFTIPLALFIIIFASLIYFNLKKVLEFVSTFPILNKITQKYPLEYEVPRRKLLIILFITTLRYIVYVSQYVYLLYFFGVDLSFELLFSAVSTMLVIHTMIPSVPFVDLGIKGNALIILLQNLTTNKLGIVLAVFSIWVINIIIPAIVGYYFFASIKKNQIVTSNDVL